LPFFTPSTKSKTLGPCSEGWSVGRRCFKFNKNLHVFVFPTFHVQIWSRVWCKEGRQAGRLELKDVGFLDVLKHENMILSLLNGCCIVLCVCDAACAGRNGFEIETL